MGKPPRLVCDPVCMSTFENALLVDNAGEGLVDEIQNVARVSCRHPTPITMAPSERGASTGHFQPSPTSHQTCPQHTPSYSIAPGQLPVLQRCAQTGQISAKISITPLWIIKGCVEGGGWPRTRMTPQLSRLDDINSPYLVSVPSRSCVSNSLSVWIYISLVLVYTRPFSNRSF